MGLPSNPHVPVALAGDYVGVQVLTCFATPAAPGDHCAFVKKPAKIKQKNPWHTSF